ncbi:MAG: hypothetical protein QOJ65_1253 [Fimbriimonadaceae bacterium]|jgi:hypothetical protein|nr:hypothetical protein [Fimbriimonadaceae bacterium]
MTADEARAVFLALPGAQEGEHHGHPDFRVRNKIFATLWPSKSCAVLRLPPELADAFAAEDPSNRRIVSRIGDMGWLEVLLADVSVKEFRSLAEVAIEQRKQR